jgi:Integral membrane protein DUF95.
MIEQILLREEEKANFPALVLLGASVSALGFLAARLAFPAETGMMSVVFASIPVIYSLTSYFFDEEMERIPGLSELKVYGSVFLGQATGFGLLALQNPSLFRAQRDIIGLTGSATGGTGFVPVLVNNLAVGAAILLLAAAIGSAGGFVLSWNASVLGVFFAELALFSPLTVLTYVPHTVLEITGFLGAGVTGTFISASLSRDDLDHRHWRRYSLLIAASVLLIVLGAGLESLQL